MFLNSACVAEVRILVSVRGGYSTMTTYYNDWGIDPYDRPSRTVPHPGAYDPFNHQPYDRFNVPDLP